MLQLKLTSSKQVNGNPKGSILVVKRVSQVKGHLQDTIVHKGELGEVPFALQVRRASRPPRRERVFGRVEQRRVCVG